MDTIRVCTTKKRNRKIYRVLRIPPQIYIQSLPQRPLAVHSTCRYCLLRVSPRIRGEGGEDAAWRLQASLSTRVQGAHGRPSCPSRACRTTALTMSNPWPLPPPLLSQLTPGFLPVCVKALQTVDNSPVTALCRIDVVRFFSEWAVKRMGSKSICH
jgi:hypothetical protein